MQSKAFPFLSELTTLVLVIDGVLVDMSLASTIVRLSVCHTSVFCRNS